MTQLKAAANKQLKTINYKATLKPVDIIGLLVICGAIQDANRSLPETISYWLHKNEKKLNGARDKAKAFGEAIHKEFAKHDDQGRMFFWNGADEDLLYVKQENKLIDPITNQPAPNGKLMPFIEDPTRRDEYNEKVKAYNEADHEVNLVKIHRDLLANIQIPTSSATGNSIDLELFYGNIVIDEDEE